MDLSGYTVVELMAARSVLSEAVRYRVTMAELHSAIDQSIAPILQARPTMPDLRLCPSCDRGETMVHVFRDGVSYWACRSCRYSEMEG